MSGKAGRSVTRHRRAHLAPTATELAEVSRRLEPKRRDAFPGRIEIYNPAAVRALTIADPEPGR